MVQSQCLPNSALGGGGGGSGPSTAGGGKVQQPNSPCQLCVLTHALWTGGVS